MDAAVLALMSWNNTIRCGALALMAALTLCSPESRVCITFCAVGREGSLSLLSQQTFRSEIFFREIHNELLTGQTSPELTFIRANTGQ